MKTVDICIVTLDNKSVIADIVKKCIETGETETRVVEMATMLMNNVPLNYGAFCFAIIANGEPVGIARAEKYPVWYEDGNIGYYIAPEHRRKGYATQVVPLLADFCIKHRFPKLTAVASITNVASIKTLERSNWKPSGIRYDWSMAKIGVEYIRR